MADKRAYFKLDVGYLTNPKVAHAFTDSPTAVLLHVGSIAYSAQHLTDGVIPMQLVARLSGVPSDDIGVLLDHGLWVDVGGGRAEIHDYLEHQRPASEVKNAADKARRAANARWKPTPDAPSNARSMPDALPDASESSMPRERGEREREETSFDTFWDAYPKKVGKGQARTAYKAAAKKAQPATILEGLRAHLPGWANTEKKFIPNPATWLNGERWSDETDATEDVNPWAHLKSADQISAERGF